MRNQQKNWLIGIILVIFIVGIALVSFGLQQTALNSDVDYLVIEQISESSNSYTYKMTFVLTEPTRFDKCDDNAPFTEKFIFSIGTDWHNTKSGSSAILPSDVTLNQQFKVKELYLNGANAQLGLCTDFQRGIPTSYHNVDTVCSISDGGGNQVGMNCDFEFDFVHDEPAWVGGIRDGYVIVEVPKEGKTLTEEETDTIIIDDNNNLITEATPEQVAEVSDEQVQYTTPINSGGTTVVREGINTVVVFSYVAYGLIVLLIGFIVYLSFFRKKGKKRK